MFLLRTFYEPKRDSFWDNLWGAITCLILATAIYLPNSGYPAGCSARAGATTYLWLCALPALTIGTMLFAAVFFPIVSLIRKKLPIKNRLGYGNLALFLAAPLATYALFIIPEAIPQAFISGVAGGAVFGLARDHFASAL